MTQIMEADFRGAATDRVRETFLADLAGGQVPAWPGWEFAVGDLHALLWERMDVFEIPARKAAAVLGAMRAVLEERRPLGGAEDPFLALCDRLTHSSSRHLDAVWRDPRVFHWVMRLHQLAGHALAGAPLAGAAARYAAALGKGEARDALAVHLTRFAHFTVGLARLDGGDHWLPEPLPLDLPLVVPGSDGCLVGTGPVTLRGASRGRLILESPDAGPGPELRPLRCAVSGSLRLPVDPHAFSVPGFGFHEPSLAAGDGYHEEHLGLVVETLGWIRRHAPWAHDAFEAGIRAIGLKPLGAGSYEDYSEPELPGTFVASVVRHPMELADHFVHELQHNRLSCLEELGSLFDPSGGDPVRGRGFYSPWRDDLRGPYGIFHGIHVNTGLCRYWLEIYRSGAVGGADLAYATGRLQRLPTQLGRALHVVGGKVPLTPWGRAILDQLEHERKKLLEEVEALGLPVDGPALRVAEDGTYQAILGRRSGAVLTVTGDLADHRGTFDVNDDCAGAP